MFSRASGRSTARHSTWALALVALAQLAACRRGITCPAIGFEDGGVGWSGKTKVPFEHARVEACRANACTTFPLPGAGAPLADGTRPSAIVDSDGTLRLSWMGGSVDDGDRYRARVLGEDGTTLLAIESSPVAWEVRHPLDPACGGVWNPKPYSFAVR